METMEPTNTWKKNNACNVRTKNKNVNSNNTITSSHLLASNYVPNNLRAINTVSVSAYIPTQALPSMKDDIERVFRGLVGGNGPYESAGNGNDTTPTYAYFDHAASAFNTSPAKMNQYNQYQEHRNNHPKATKTVNEAEFADKQVRKRLNAVVVPSASPISSLKNIHNAATVAAAAKQIPSIGKDMVPGVIDETGTNGHYLAVFRELMQVEQAEVQRLYEKAYDNYKIKITTPSAASTQGGMQNNGVAQFKVMGIADGRPSIQPGDTVLIRPHEPIYVPLRSVSGSQTVEVVSRVLAVNRGKENKKVQQKDQVLISWVEDRFLDMHLKRQFCTVRFIPASTAHERCLTALSWLKSINPYVARDILFPSKPPKLPPPPAIEESNTDADTTEEREYEKLNTNQARFVQMVTARTAYPTKERVRPPMVLTGPAGTGKTKTLLATILQILRMDQQQRLQRNQQETSTSNESKPLRSRILICTPSHTACDVITERLVNFLSEVLQKESNDGNLKKIRDKVRKMVFRLYDGATRAVNTVPVQVLPYTRQGGDGGQFVLPDTQELLDFSVIVCTCHDAHILYLAGLTNSSLRRQRVSFQSDMERRIRESGLELCGTIEGSSSPHFTHLFIDEAAQATEPECLIPLSVVVDDDPGAIKVEIALCGDPRQLGPSIYSPKALEGLQRSLLERLLRLPVDTYGGGRDHLMGPHTPDSRLSLDEMIEYSFQKTDYRQHLSVFLNLSYRGHPSFLYMPSKLFYFDKLTSICKNASDNKWIKAVRKIELLSENAYPESRASKQMDWPVVFRGVKGKCTSMAIGTYFGSNCWCNLEEARVMVDMIKEVKKAGILTSSIGVMAAFRAQVVLIRKLLRAEKLGNVNVGMVEDYQSMERHVIILSLTRTNKSLMQADVTSGEGLFRQPKRMNVALTRAERVLVVVGEPNIMREDKAWGQWLGFCKDNGLWYGEKGEESSYIRD